VYIFREGKSFLFLGTHVDDLFPLYNKGGENFRDKILKALQTRMTIDNKGEINFALDTRIQADRERGVLKISQAKYTQALLAEYNMHSCKERETPSLLTDMTESDLPKTEEEKESEQIPGPEPYRTPVVASFNFEARFELCVAQMCSLAK